MPPAAASRHTRPVSCPTANAGDRTVDLPATVAATRPAVLCVQQRDSAKIRSVLSALQAPVLDCRDGAAAIAAAGGKTLSCAIAPLAMPDMPAGTLIAGLHAVAPGLAVLIVVDGPAIADTVALMRAGAHAVIDGAVVSTGLMVHLAPLLRGR